MHLRFCLNRELWKFAIQNWKLELGERKREQWCYDFFVCLFVFMVEFVSQLTMGPCCIPPSIRASSEKTYYIQFIYFLILAIAQVYIVWQVKVVPLRVMHTNAM